MNRNRKILYSILVFSIICFVSYNYFMKYFHYNWSSVNTHGKYTGEFKGLNYDGFGKFEFASGIIYEGSWKEGIMEGHGKMTFTDGSKYEGEFVDGYYNGKGKLTSANGKTIVGIWKEGKLVNSM